MYFNTYLPAPMARELQRNLNSAAGCTNCGPHITSHLRSEVVEREHGWELLLDLPGLDREDVEILVENDVLVVKGNRNREALAEADRLAHSNRLYGSFEKRWRLSDEIDRAKVSARMDKGVLRIELGKADQALPKRVEIKVE